MNIEKTSFGPWSDAYRLTVGPVEAVAVAEIGPRIMLLRVNGGENLLFDDSAGDIGRGDWKIRGGHRFWIAPETEATYHPDNQPCQVEQSDGQLKLTAPAEPGGLQKTMIIRANETGDGFEIRHQLQNTSDMLAEGAIWTLTCVLPKGRILSTWGDDNPHWNMPMVKFWTRWAGSTTNPASSQWIWGDETFGVDPTGEVGKAGLWSRKGWLAQLRPDATFAKTTRPRPEATYPDGGCNIELYTCEHFNEMETLGPVQLFRPGVTYVHTEVWRVTDQAFDPEDWQGVARHFDL